MKIAIISSVYEQTPPLKYGGIERVLDFLVKGLKTKGHDVTLFATGDSNSPCELVHFFEHPVTSYDLKAQVIHSQKACRYINEHNFDIVQNNIDISVGLKDLLKVPMVHTLHMDVLNKNKQFIFNHFKDANYVAISDKQRENAESYGLNVISRIYNGLDVENYSPALKRGKYLAYLGNFAPFKGPHIAIEVAQKTGIPLKLAGKVNAMGKEYFEKEIAPYLDSSDVEYVGELNDEEKREFLKNSMGVLFPSTWEEPFGLVIIEAMACGVPVIGFPVGAVPEIIRHGENGFIAKNVNEMCSYTKQLSNRDAQTCYQYVVNNFSIEKMVTQYENVFNILLNIQ